MQYVHVFHLKAYSACSEMRTSLWTSAHITKCRLYDGLGQRRIFIWGP